MTANASPEDRDICLASGMDGYIAKPIRVPDLVAQIAATTQREPAGRIHACRSRRMQRRQATRVGGVRITETDS